MTGVKLFFSLVGIAGVCAALGYLGFLAFSYNQAFLLSSAELTRTRTALNSTLTVYGTIRSIDKNSRIIEIDAINAYQSGGPALTYRALVLDNAFIGRQEAVQDGGIYTNIPPAAPADISALEPGMRVKFLATRTTGLVINYLIYGNPL